MERNSEAYANLFSIFDMIYPISYELKKSIMQKSNIIEIKKKTVILEAGKDSRFIYFIISGGARVYYVDKGGREINTWFLFENELLISVFGFFTGLPSFEFIEVIEDSKLIAVEREKLEEMYREFLEFNYIGRKLTESYYIRNEEQANSLRTLGARERYEKLLQTNPEILKRVSLGHIASYLGISQETLSRIRGQR